MHPIRRSIHRPHLILLILLCVEPDVSDCTPVVETNLNTDRWSLRLPQLTGAFGGQIYDLKLTATAPTSQTIEWFTQITVHPAAPSFEITCTKRIDPVDGFQVDFDVLQNGLPITGLFEHGLWLYEDKDDGEGFALDETDSFHASFAFIFPYTFSPGADGIYQILFSATPDFATGVQAALYFTDDGGPDDVCVWE